MSSITDENLEFVETGIFDTIVYQEVTNSCYRSGAGVDILAIRFCLYKVIKYCNRFEEFELEPGVLLAHYVLKLRISRERRSCDSNKRMDRLARYRGIIARSPREKRKFKRKMVRYLSMIGAPEEEHESIIEKILEELKDAVPDLILDVQMAKFITRYTAEHFFDDTHYRAKLIPATESFIQGLEKVTSLESFGGQTCAICMEAFAAHHHLNRLPCLHSYHQHCIVQWLQINHVCPICRHPYPYATASAEPSDPNPN
ncbi:hypothetical protein ABKV19_000780 [Rosa sericea]